jgi:UDP-glucose 4-epimerase
VLKAGHDALVVDSLVNGHAAAIARVGQLTSTQIPLEFSDVRDKDFLERVF